jgi:hypothetical protein
MISYEDLGNQSGKLSESSQQVQHETEMLTRRLTVARTALETISKGEYAPEVLKTAREALNTPETPNALDALRTPACHAGGRGFEFRRSRTADSRLVRRKKHDGAQDRRKFLSDARASPLLMFGLMINSRTVMPESST